MADTSETHDLTKMKVPELKKLLKLKGLSTTGNKADLVERLLDVENIEGLDGDLDEDADLDELNDDSMLDEDDELELEAEKETEALLEEKENTEIMVISSTQEVGEKADDTLKTLFKAKAITVESESEKLKSRGERFGIQSDDVKKQTRADRFGVVSADSAKQKRAERFGITDVKSTAKSGDAPLAIVSGVDTEKLKKRAERFGGAVSSQFSAIKDVDTLKKRAERFGQVTSKTLDKIDTDEKAEKRKERFGQITPTSEASQEAKKLRLERFAAK